MRVRANVLAFVLVAVLSTALAGCTSAPSSPSPTSPPAGGASTSAAADPVAQITANWEEFFNAKTANDRRVQLIENGPAFSATLQAQASNPLAAAATVKVSKVTLSSPTQAAVTYSILVNGQPALPDQQGVAVLDGGTWKVSAASFCALLTLESGGKTDGLPAPCLSGAPGSASASPQVS